MHLTQIQVLGFVQKQKRFKVLKALKILKNDAPGVVIDGNLTVACKKNSIKIISLQKEGKQVSSAKEFLLGNEIKKGTKIKLIYNYQILIEYDGTNFIVGKPKRGKINTR